ncbi:MAG: hypothetical protein KKB31_04185 [Nanoarchaeota archaeon]|nr:hypothetical protein [Nanoarchaeota archaeon]
MEEILGKVIPILDTIREWIMKGAVLLANSFDVNVDNVYLVLILIISIWLGRKILTFFYSNLEGRMVYWLIISGAIFYILKFLGI